MALQVHVGFDVSASMNTADRMGKAKELVRLIVDPIAAIDPDGVPVYTFGQSVKLLGTYKQGDDFSKFVSGLTANEYRTNTGAFLSKVFGTIRNELRNAPDDEHIVLVITDGEATDKPVVEAEIKRQMKAIARDEQTTVAFVTVGHDADTWLQKLDDDLASGDKDIVDAKPIEEFVQLAQDQGIETLLEAIIHD